MREGRGEPKEKHGGVLQRDMLRNIKNFNVEFDVVNGENWVQKMTQEPEACRQGLHTKGCLDSTAGQVVAVSQGKEMNAWPLGVKFKLYWEAEKNP